MLYGFDANLAQPCVVKNTFLHIVGDWHGADVEDRSHGSVRREKSAPPKFKSAVPAKLSQHLAQQDSQDLVDVETIDTDNSGDEVDNINSVSLDIYSESSWIPQSSRQISTQSDLTDYTTMSNDSEASPLARAFCGKFGPVRDDASKRADTGSTPESLASSDGGVPDGTGGMLACGSPAQMRNLWGSRLDPVSWGAGVTTVMVRQIPRQLSQLQFLKEVNKRGYEGLYDFLYLPSDARKGINVGYGFINFHEPNHAQGFRVELEGTFLDRHMKMKGKPLRVHPAKVQGYEANYQHFAQTKTGQKQDPRFSPLFFPRRHTNGARGPAVQGGTAYANGYGAQSGMGLGHGSMPVLFEGSSEMSEGMWRQPYPQQQQSPSTWQDSGELSRQGSKEMPEGTWMAQYPQPPAPGSWSDSGDLARQGPTGMSGSPASSSWSEMPERSEEFTDMARQGMNGFPSASTWTEMPNRPEGCFDLLRQGQLDNQCPMCGYARLSDHKFCVRCGAGVAVMALRAGPSEPPTPGPQVEEGRGAKFLPEFQSKSRKIRSEVVVARFTAPCDRSLPFPMFRSAMDQQVASAMSFATGTMPSPQQMVVDARHPSNGVCQDFAQVLPLAAAPSSSSYSF